MTTEHVGGVPLLPGSHLRNNVGHLLWAREEIRGLKEVHTHSPVVLIIQVEVCGWPWAEFAGEGGPSGQHGREREACGR